MRVHQRVSKVAGASLAVLSSSSYKNIAVETTFLAGERTKCYDVNDAFICIDDRHAIISI